MKPRAPPNLIQISPGDFIWYSEQLLGDPTPSAAAAGPAPASGSWDDAAASDAAASDAAPTLKPVAVLLPPDRQLLPRGLPSQHYGSDHICLMSVFELC
jgi:hypothetical protein